MFQNFFFIKNWLQARFLNFSFPNCPTVLWPSSNTRSGRRGRTPPTHHRRSACGGADCSHSTTGTRPQLRRPWTQPPAVLVGCQDDASTSAEVTPQVKVPAEPANEEDNSPLAVAWRQLEANLKAAKELAKESKAKKAAVMTEWAQFHDQEGATRYCAGWGRGSPKTAGEDCCRGRVPPAAS